jgi:SAM-dependent methyltransferase
MNIRRLPAWILSMAQHMRTHGPWPDGRRHYMPTADEMVEDIYADYALRRMTDGPRFPVQAWLRQEHLAEDVAALLERFGQLTDAARQGIASVPYLAKGYDHDLEATFTAEQIRRMYRLNPGWAEAEQRVYGDLYQPADPDPPDLRSLRSIPARLSRMTGPSRRRASSSQRRSGNAGTDLRTRHGDHDEIEIDGWLTGFAGPQLDAIDDQLAAEGGSLDNYRLFRNLDDWTWALLLSRRYTRYLSILETVPHVPEPELQQRWSGAHGLTLLSRSLASYRHLRSMHARHGSGELPTARILDSGCGWGRLTRFFCRDVDPGCLHACEPDEELLQICRRSHLPAVLHQTDRPSEGNFDLVYSSSVFPHLSEASTVTYLTALHESLNPGGLLVLTIPPPADPDRDDESGEAPAPIGLRYLREDWGDHFELVDVTVPIDDIYAVSATLRRT